MQNSQNQQDELGGSSLSLLLSLPEELIEHVCQQLSLCRDYYSKRKSRESLAALCRTSKALNRIATRFLYYDYSGCGYPRRFALYLRTLYERPDLCLYVHSLSFDGDLWFYSTYTLPQEYIGFISKAAERFGLEVTVPLKPFRYSLGGTELEGEEEEENVDSGNEYQSRSGHGGEIEDEVDSDSSDSNDQDESEEEAFRRSQLGQYPYETMAQLIIALTPNLRELEFTAGQIMCDEGAGAFTLLGKLARRSPPQVSLPHLHYFFFGHESYRQISFKYFEDLIALAPNIRTIHCSPCFDQPEYAPKAPIHIRNVTELRIKAGHLSEVGLRAIVSSCQRLEVFQYHYASRYAGLDLKCATPREVIDIVSQHKDSLLHIHLNLGSREEHQGDEEYFGLCIEGHEILSLKDFSCLETFHVDGSSILFPEAGSKEYHSNILLDMLPRSIRKIHLRDMQKEVVANLMTLTDSIEYLPYLSEIFLSGNRIDGPLGKFEVVFEESEIDILRERLKSRGIKFLKRAAQQVYDVSDDEEVREDW